MSEAPLVSVVIPAYNAAEFVGDAIDSVLAQTYRPIEVLVADDGSRDGTGDVVRRYGPPVQYLRQENRGPAGARNLGLGRARGEYIAFLDADDTWDSRKLELQVRTMQESPELGLLGTLASDPTAPDAAGISDRPEVRRLNYLQLYLGNVLMTSSIIVRRSCLEAAGRFDEQFFGPEDFDLWLRIAERAEVGVLRCPLAFHREVEGSVQGDPERMRKNVYGVLRKADREGSIAVPIWTRLQSRAILDFRTAWHHMVAGSRSTALLRLARSVVLYPLPLNPAVLRQPLGRLRLLVRLCRPGVGGKDAAGEAR